MTDQEWLARLPKLDLHYHFDGSMRLETIFDILSGKGERVTLDGLRDEVVIQGGCPDLATYLRKFERAFQCEQTRADIERIAFEHVEDAAKSNIMYFEVRFAPELMRREGLSCPEVIDSVLMGLRRGMAAFPQVIARAIVCGMRGDGLAANLEVTRAALERKDEVAAVDIAGNEVDTPPLSLLDMFDLARENGMPYTIHAGEAGDPQYIKEAAMLGAGRIGHGIHIGYDANLMRFFAKRRIALEMCPTSNIQTHTVASFAEYPIRDYFDKGLMVTVNTDNTTVSSTTLVNEFLILTERFGFTRDEILVLTNNAIDCCFAPEETKELLRGRLRAFIQQYHS
jgi:adenosine deaminase